MVADLAQIDLPADAPDLPDGWRYELLGDLVDDRGISYGIVQPGNETDDGVPIVRVNNIRNGRVDTRDVLRVDPIIEEKFKRSRLLGGEVLLTLVGTLGEVAVAPDDLHGWNVARAVAVIPVRDDPGSAWVSICLRSSFIQYCIRMWATTTVQATFNLRDLAKLPIPMPPKETRDAIAAVLGTLDDKIELNRRINATLEAMARALFQSWFVDFDPVRAKLDGRQPTGLDPAIAALFPDEFEDSGLGPIPKGWEVRTLGDLIELPYGRPLKADDRREGTVGVYGSNGLIGWHDQRLVRGPGIVVGRKGNPGVITWVHDDFYPIDTTFYVVPTNRCRSLYFLNYALQTHDLPNLSADSAVPGLNRNHAYMSEQIVPPADVLRIFDLQAARFFEMIHVNGQQSRTLAATRDALLPKLLCGELRPQVS